VDLPDDVPKIARGDTRFSVVLPLLLVRLPIRTLSLKLTLILNLTLI